VSKRRKLWIIIVGAVLGAVVLFLIAGIAIFGPRARRHHLEEIDRWTAIVHMSQCIRDAMKPDEVMKQTAASTDPRQPNVMFPQLGPVPEATCRGEVDTLLGMEAFDMVQGVLTDWRTAYRRVDAAEDALLQYFKHRDWQDDHYASGEAKWKEAHEAVTAGIAATAAMRARVLPVLDHEIHRYVLQYEDREGRDAIYWKLQVGYLMQVASDDQLRGETSKVAADLADLEAAMKAAPLEVRRNARGFYPSPGYTNGVLQSLTGRRSVVVDP
jgi:hypothetical protein